MSRDTCARCPETSQLVPLIGQLSNRQFGQNLAPLIMPVQPPDRSDEGHRNLCACGCEAAVTAPRKFVNQEHYSAWLSRVRYFGRNRLMLVAGGSGIVPLMAMIRTRAAAGDDTETRLLYSSRSQDDVIYRDELERLSGNGLTVVHALTDSQPPGWRSYARRVDAEMLAEVAPAPAERPRFYACGPTPFVEAVAEALVQLGHDPRAIKTERFGPTGR
jgi:Oxidoreductase NAD-binding domain